LSDPTRSTARVGVLLVAAGLVVPIVAPSAAAASSPVMAKPAAMAPAATAACALRGDVVRRSDPTLGAGVRVSTGHEGDVFPAGARTRLTITRPTAGPATQRIRLKIRSESHPVASRHAGLRRASSQPSQHLRVPNRPGWYQVRAERIGNGRVLGVSCLWYGVAMPGASLNLDNLPAGKDWGGAGPLRDVALHHELGLDVVRFQFNVAQFRDNPTYADPEVTEAAHRAHRLGMRFIVSIGQGGAAETAAVKNGSWRHLVRRIVATYPAVQYWMPWNEPNCGECFFGTVRTYVHKVLVPAVKAVRATSPRAKIVGGSAISDDLGWWKRFAALGGFHDLDVVGVNPYTNGLGAPESEGLVSVLKSVHHLAKAAGAAGKPILDTESAWPSAAPDARASLATQSDYVDRKLVLERALGVSSGEYLVEGGWQDWDLIDYFRGVKPAAMAASATATLLAHRHFLGWVSTAIPQIWAARFSAGRAGGSQLIAAWSSAGNRTVHLSCSASGFDSFGAPISFHRRLHASGAIRFITAPHGSHCLR
jgi:hypothetical protein